MRNDDGDNDRDDYNDGGGGDDCDKDDYYDGIGDGDGGDNDYDVGQVMITIIIKKQW